MLNSLAVYKMACYVVTQNSITRTEGEMSWKTKALRASRTEKNLLTSFAGESQARNRYTYYAGVARKEGFIQVAGIFEETADNEKEHAKRMFKFLEGGKRGNYSSLSCRPYWLQQPKI